MAVRHFRLTPRLETDEGSFLPFAATGFVSNPFPEPGLDTGALYVDHMAKQVDRLEGWVDGVVTATDVQPTRPVQPIAVRGSIGVGKTHLLKSLERRLSSRPKIAVVRKNLPDEGMERLLLATLLLGSLPYGDEDFELPAEPSPLPLLDRIVTTARSAPAGGKVCEALRALRGPGTLVFQPLLLIVAEPDPSREAQLRSWFARWLVRGHTTPVQRNKLGLARPLEGEGQAIRAVAELLRAARAAELVHVWFVLVDQLEDLWRTGVITPGRRARFLTDLRTLIDLGLEGAPIAVLLAWNTEVTAGEDKLEGEYQALWRRLGQPVDLPGLEAKDVWPFAKEYVRHAERLAGAKAKDLRAQFGGALEQSTKDVLTALRADPRASLGPQRFASYRVLHHWRETARELAKTFGS